MLMVVWSVILLKVSLQVYRKLVLCVFQLFGAYRYGHVFITRRNTSMTAL